MAFDPIASVNLIMQIFCDEDESIIVKVGKDDCAIVKVNDTYLAFTSDYLNFSPIASQLGIGNYYILGKLLVASNISDLCGTGALPKYIQICIMIPKDIKNHEFEQLLLGIHEECKKYNVIVTGGDTKIGANLILNATAIGVAQTKENLFTLQEAKPGHVVWASGFLGSVSASVLAIKCIDDHSILEWAKNSIISSNVPLQKSRFLSEKRIGGAGTDISDGLGMDMNAICTNSNVGVELYADHIPIDPMARCIAKKLAILPWKLAFTIGGDFQFIVTTDKKYSSIMKKEGFHEIGVITAKRTRTIRLGDRLIEMPLGGHNDANGQNFAQEIHDLLRA